MQALMHDAGVDGIIQGWDWRYYAEKVRQARYEFDENALRPYF
jgi:peptidyl-dipeptidase Dcp